MFGNPPYNTYGHVPALSHYLNDMVPYYLCCEWSDLCDSFLYVRETADCKGYRYTKTGKFEFKISTNHCVKNINQSYLSCYIWGPACDDV